MPNNYVNPEDIEPEIIEKPEGVYDFNDRRLEKLLALNGAFHEFYPPVLHPDGRLKIYEIMPEALAREKLTSTALLDDSNAALRHGVKMMKKYPDFEEAIDILAREVQYSFDDYYEKMEREDQKPGMVAISGGQGTDWLFSGPVSKKLGVPHLALYREDKIGKGRMEYSDLNNSFLVKLPINDVYFIHVTGLFDSTDPVFKPEQTHNKGWMPMIRRNGGIICNLIALVSTNNGNDQLLKDHKIDAKSLFRMDEQSLAVLSRNYPLVSGYCRDPEAWTKNYLDEHGAGQIVDSLGQRKEALSILDKFVQRYGTTLTEAGWFKGFAWSVEQKYQIKISPPMAQ